MGNNTGADYIFSVPGPYASKMIPCSSDNNAKFAYNVGVQSTLIVLGDPFINDKGYIYIYISGCRDCGW